MAENFEIGKDFISIHGYVKAWKEKKVEKMPFLGVFNIGYLSILGYSIYKAIL